LKRISSYFCFFFIFILLGSTICLSKNDGITLDKALKKMEKNRKNAFVVGSFTMVHEKWDYCDPNIQSPEDINKDCITKLVVSLQNTDSNKTYDLKFKPIINSTVSAYSKKLLANNTQDPYWVLEVPPGNYGLTTVSFKISIIKSGYSNFEEKDMVTVPLSRDIKRDVTFDVKANQIVYVGDYFAEFKTNIVLFNHTRFYPYNQFRVTLSDNFAKMKDDLLNHANEKNKNINDCEIISVL